MEQEYYFYRLDELYGMSNPNYSNFPINWSVLVPLIKDKKSGSSNWSNLTSDADVTYLVQPLINRWCNDHIYLVKSDTALTINTLTANNKLARIWSKLNDMLPTYKELYNRYQAMLTAINGGLSNEATTTSINRHNDTPNSASDYSAKEYTSDITQNTTTSKQTNNKLDDYDIIRARIENLPQQIIDEMKRFEIWI